VFLEVEFHEETVRIEDVTTVYGQRKPKQVLPCSPSASITTKVTIKYVILSERNDAWSSSLEYGVGVGMDSSVVLFRAAASSLEEQQDSSSSAILVSLMEGPNDDCPDKELSSSLILLVLLKLLPPV
jgi:hypothetical protein